ncbi:hypothetical protein Pelo_4223 [Pelomyxa schiedti]|nr:hypothetical protein Pelo_4223 [Pelomyxa schiedti]
MQEKEAGAAGGGAQAERQHPTTTTTTTTTTTSSSNSPRRGPQNQLQDVGQRQGPTQSRGAGGAGGQRGAAAKRRQQQQPNLPGDGQLPLIMGAVGADARQGTTPHRARTGHAIVGRVPVTDNGDEGDDEKAADDGGEDEPGHCSNASEANMDDGNQEEISEFNRNFDALVSASGIVDSGPPSKKLRMAGSTLPSHPARVTPAQESHPMGSAAAPTSRPNAPLSALSIPKPGTVTLGDIPAVCKNIKKALHKNPHAVAMLHRIIFGKTELGAINRVENLLDFSGLSAESNEETRARFHQTLGISKKTLTAIICLLNLNFPKDSTKEAMVRAILRFLAVPHHAGGIVSRETCAQEMHTQLEIEKREAKLLAKEMQEQHKRKKKAKKTGNYEEDSSEEERVKTSDPGDFVWAQDFNASEVTEARPTIKSLVQVYREKLKKDKKAKKAEQKEKKAKKEARKKGKKKAKKKEKKAKKKAKKNKHIPMQEDEDDEYNCDDEEPAHCSLTISKSKKTKKKLKKLNKLQKKIEKLKKSLGQKTHHQSLLL